MSEKPKAGDFVIIKGQEDKHPFTYIVTEGDLGGMTLVSRWYRTDTLTKVAVEEGEAGK